MKHFQSCRGQHITAEAVCVDTTPTFDIIFVKCKSSNQAAHFDLDYLNKNCCFDRQQWITSFTTLWHIARPHRPKKATTKNIPGAAQQTRSKPAPWYQSHLICPAAPSPAWKPCLFCSSCCCRGLAAALPLPRPSPLWGLRAVWAPLRMPSPWPSAEIQLLLLLACTLGPAILGPISFPMLQQLVSNIPIQYSKTGHHRTKNMSGRTISTYRSILTSPDILI